MDFASASDLPAAAGTHPGQCRPREENGAGKAARNYSLARAIASPTDSRVERYHFNGLTKVISSG